jgi:hypothetical protein
LALEPLAAGDPPAVGGYRLRGRLGAGGMGRVYLAFTPGGRPVAVKVVRPELGDDPDFRVRFRQEIVAARRVHGLFTAQVLDADPDGSPPWMVTAYVAGPSLARAVADHGPLPVESVFLLVAGVAEALAAIHAAGVVHRDLKPSNVLLAADGPRVIDFGIARAVETTALTRTGMLVGSPQYMAPEQVRGGVVSAAGDVFALGSLAGFAAMGRAPFGEGSEAAVLYRVQHEEPDLGGCPAVLREVIGGCLTKDPAGRPSPVSLIEACRDRAAGKTVEFSDSWLPSTVAADLNRHAAPAAPAEAGPQARLAAGHLAAAPGGWAGGPGGLAGGPGGLAAAPGGLAGGPGGLAGGPGGPRRSWRDLPRGVLAGAAVAAVLLAALAGYGVFTLTGPGSSPGAASGPPGLARGAGHRDRKKAPASPSPSPSPTTVTQCLIGTWTETSEEFSETFDGAPVTFTGGVGAIQIFETNGINIIEYHNTTYTTHLNGNTWTEVETGRASVHYVVQNGVLLSSNLSASGNVELLENGSYNNGGPMTLNMDPDNVSCSGNTLRLYATDGASVDLTRDVPKAPSGS